MAKSMSPSDTAETIREGQIGKINELLSAALRKSRIDFPASSVQWVLENQGIDLVRELVQCLRHRVGIAGGLVVRRVRIHSLKTPQQMLDATECSQVVDRFGESPVNAIPHCEVCETVLYLFKVGRPVSDEELDLEYERLGLKPANPCLVIQANIDDPSFAVTNRNCTHWKGANGEWYYIGFDSYIGGRRVVISRDDRDFDDFWWFAGVRIAK